MPYLLKPYKQIHHILYTWTCSTFNYIVQLKFWAWSSSLKINSSHTLLHNILPSYHPYKECWPQVTGYKKRENKIM